LKQTGICIFHAKHLGCEETNLWERGTYWHFGTRPDEWEAMPDSDLKQKASAIDEALKHAPVPTLIHGDAKLANFCFSEDNTQVAAVDFQYVGHGCAMKDVMLFISSRVPVDQAKDFEELLLDYYFSQFEEAIFFIIQNKTQSRSPKTGVPFTTWLGRIF
jgi:Ser/Thr protein kinase RdoA (MazF antagonist)